MTNKQFALFGQKGLSLYMVRQNDYIYKLLSISIL